MDPVLATRTDQDVPPLVDLSISYPVIDAPPLLAGADQARFICEYDMAVAPNPVGAPGTVADVVAAALVDGEPVPMAFIADTL